MFSYNNISKDRKKVDSGKIDVDIQKLEYQQLTERMGELQKIGETYGKIMIPLSLGILVLATNFIQTFPTIGIILFVILSISAITIWRLISYSASGQQMIIYNRVRALERQLGIYDSQRLYWGTPYLPKLMKLRISLLLNLFALEFILCGIALIIVKIWLYP